MANTLAVRKPPTRQLLAPATAMWFLLSAPLPPSDPGLSHVSSQSPCPAPSSPCMPSRSPSPPPPLFLPPSFLRPLSQTPASLPLFALIWEGCWPPHLTLQSPTGRVMGKESRAVRRLGRASLGFASVWPGAPGLLPPAVSLLERKQGPTSKRHHWGI